MKFFGVVALEGLGDITRLALILDPAIVLESDFKMLTEIVGSLLMK